MLANNPSVLTGGGVATNVVNGTFQLIGPTGSIALTAQGTNQNITLTPSGTGNTYTASPLQIFRNISLDTSPPTYVGDIQIGSNANGDATTNAGGIDFKTAISGAGFGMRIAGAFPSGASVLQFLKRTNSVAWTEIMRLNDTGNLLIGTNTDSSNGKLQLATHTTSAGGIGFGTDWSFFRVSNSSLSITSSTTVALSLINDGTNIGVFRGAGTANPGFFCDGNSFHIRSGNSGGAADAVVFDTSLNTTFFGIVIHKSYTVATLPAAAAGNTYGTTFVSDATNAAGTGIGTAPTGGGAVKRAVYSTGAAWLLL